MSARPKKQPVARTRRRRAAKALALVTLLIIAALFGLWALLESAAGEEWARRWIETRASMVLEREVTVETFDWNLVPFSATLTGIRIAGPPQADEALLRAASLRVRVRAWALLSRELRLSAVEVDTPVVHWDTGAGPNLVLEAGGGGNLGLAVESLRVEGGVVEVNHRRWNLDTALTEVDLRLDPVEGRFATTQRRTGVLRVGGGGLQLEAPAVEAPGAAPERLDIVSAEVPFTVDERRLSIDSALLLLGNSELMVSGQISDWERAVLEVDGRIDVRDLVGLTGVQVAASDSGLVALDATLTYGPEPVRLVGRLSSPAVTLAGIEATDLSAALEADTSTVVFDDLRVGVFEGTVEARVEADLSTDPRTWRVRYEARGIDLNQLSSSPALPGFRFAGTAAASGELSWQDPISQTITGQSSLDLSLPAGLLARVSEDAASAAAEVGARPAATTPAPAGPALTGTAQQVAPSLPLPVTAHADLTLDRGDLVVQNGTASLPRTEIVFDGFVTRERAVAATLRVESEDLRMLDRFFNQLRRYRGEQPTPRPLGAEGAGSAVAVIGGTLDEPTVNGTLAASNLSVADNAVGNVEGDFSVVGTAVEVSNLRLRRGTGTGQGEVRFRIGEAVAAGPDYSAELSLQDFPLRLSLPVAGATLATTGEVDADVSLAGSYGGPPVGIVTLRSQALTVNGVEDLRADIQLHLDADAWVAERFELTGPRAAITLSGTWLRAEDRIQATLEAEGVDASLIGDLRGEPLPVEGSLQVQAQIVGPLSRPAAAATARWTEARAYGAALGSVALSAELRDGRIAVSAVGRPGPTAPAVPPPTPTAAGGDVAVPLDSAPPGGWSASLSADLEEPRRATARASGAADVALAFAAAQGYDAVRDLDVEGTLEASGHGVLGDWTVWEGNAELVDFSVSRGGLTFSMAQPMHLELGNGLLQIEMPSLVSEAGSLQASGVIDLETGRWSEASSTGLVSLAVLGALSGVDATGTLEVDLEATGEVLAGEVAGSLELYDVSVSDPDWPWSPSDLNGTVLLGQDSLELIDVSGVIEERPFAVDGTLPFAALAGDETSAPVALDLSVDALPLTPLWERTGPLQALLTGGEASVTVRVNGRGTDWRTYDGRIEVRALSVDLTDLTLDMLQPTALRVVGNRLEITEPIVLQGPGTDLQVMGAFLLDPFRLETRLQGSANLDPLNAITGSWGLAGRAELDVEVTGDPPELSYDGTMSVTSGLFNPPVMQPIENVTAELVLEDRLVRIVSFAGSLGEATATQPNVSGDGEIQLVNSVPGRFVFNVAVDDAMVRLQRDMRLRGSAEVVLDGTPESSILSGSMNVSDGEYTARWEDEDFAVGTGSELLGFDHPLARTIALDLELVAPRNLRISNNVMDVELSADLEVRGTLAEPVLLGSTTVLDGTMTFRDQRYRFLRGSIEFQNPLRTEPSVDIVLETSIRQYLVTISASGSPARGDLSIIPTSSPPLSDLQLIQLLTVGSAPDEGVSGTEGATIGAVGAQATSFLTRQYLSQVERGAQRVFGIDRFRVEPSVAIGSGDPTARVTFGKQVTRDLVVTWTTVLGTTEEQLVMIEYQLTRNIRLTATREEDGALGIDIRFEHRFR